MASVAIANTNL